MSLIYMTRLLLENQGDAIVTSSNNALSLESLYKAHNSTRLLAILVLRGRHMSPPLLQNTLSRSSSATTSIPPPYNTIQSNRRE